jgi:hypothetical protein
MEPFIFSLYLAISHGMPVEFSLEIYRLSQLSDWIEPEDLAGTVIAEHADRRDFPTDSLSSAGAIGLAQVMPSVRREYNADHGTTYTAQDLYDWRVNLEISAGELARVKRVHATKARCRGKAHHWSAHYLCPFRSREECSTRWRERVIRSAGGWRSWLSYVDAMGSNLLPVGVALLGVTPESS